jgi:small conductance mechanosensitive channel
MIQKRLSRTISLALACLLLGGWNSQVFAQYAGTDEAAPEAEPRVSEPLPAPEPEAARTAAELAEPATRIPVDTSAADLALLVLPLTVDELAEEAAAWMKVIQARTSDIVDQKIAMVNASGDAKAQLGQELKRMVQERRPVFQGFETILKSWEAKGGDADAIAADRQYVLAVRADELKATDTSTLWKVARDWLLSKDGGLKLVWRLILFCGALFLVYLLAKLATRLVGKAMHRVEFSILLENFLTRAAFWVTLLIGTLTLLSWLGVRMTPLLTMLGGVSFVVAFAMQSTLSNFAAGLMIMIYKPFDMDNVVTVGGVTGKVKNMSLVSTTLVTGDNQVIVVPNSNVWGSIITNVNVSDTRRVDLVFGIGYDDDEQAAAKIMEEVVAAHPKVLKDPAPVVKLNELAASSVNFVCRPWAKSADYWDVYWDVTAQVKQRFDEAGISIPYPQQDVHMHTVQAKSATG